MSRSPLFVQSQPGGMFAVLDSRLTTGSIFYVCSVTGTDGAGYGQNPDSPCATIAFAIGLCTASKGDTIFVMPGHLETISVASGITLNVAGVSIIGLGVGANRPTITWSATGSTFLISAANCIVRNIRCTATAAATKLFSVTAAGVTLDAVDYVEGSAVPLQFVLTAATTDQFTLKNCYHVAVTAGASAQIWVELVGPDDALIQDNIFHLALNNNSGSYTIRASTAAVRAIILRNMIVQTGGTSQTAAISLVSTSTGFVSDNRVGANVTNIAGTIALASAYAGLNYITRTVNKSGILDPVVDS